MEIDFQPTIENQKSAIDKIWKTSRQILLKIRFWRLRERTAHCIAFEHFRNWRNQLWRIRNMFLERLAQECGSFSMTKISTFWNLREAAFCEGSREAPGRLCKKLLPRSFLPTGSFAIFLYTFLFRCSDHTFGPGGRKYWPPRALKTWGARTTISQNNYTANLHTAFRVLTLW